MNVYLIGGTGLLGSEAAAELIRRGHGVAALALPPAPPGAALPAGMALEFGSYLDMSDDEIKRRLALCEGFVFAAGVDERVEGPAPIYEMFNKYNIIPLRRWLRLAKECGVKHAVVCGSYFSYFDKLWLKMELQRWHPYIRSRREQEDMALSFADGDFDVSILELPYIFGTQPGRRPVWVFLVERIRAMRKATLYPAGGTAMITARQAGQAIAGALERGRGGRCYPIGWYNLTWKEFLKIVHRHMGCPDKPIRTVPKLLFQLGMWQEMRRQRAAGHEGGLDMVRFAAIQCARTFIDKSLGCVPLGVEPDDIDAAIGQSVRLCLEVLDGRVETIGMKGE